MAWKSARVYFFGKSEELLGVGEVGLERLAVWELLERMRSRRVLRLL